MLPFVSCHMHDNFEMMQVLVSVKTMFERCTTNFYFEHSEVGIKTAIAHL